MVTQWTIFVIVLVSNAVLAAAIAILLNRRNPAPGRDALIWMLFGLAVWAFGYAMITVFPTLEEKLFWLRIENIGILTVPVFWFLFTVQYAQVDKWLNRYTGALFFVIPLISLIFIVSEDWFSLYYSSVRPVSASGGPLVIERGPWYLVGAIQSYALNLAGMVVLIWRFVYYRNIYRRQLTVLVGAVLIPVVANLFYQFAPRILPQLSLPIDLTPVSFTITALLISVGVFGLRLFDLIPIARHTILEHIPEMVFVVDAHDRVLDANSAAQHALGKSLEEIIGRDPLEVFEKWPQLLNRFLTSDEAHEEIQVPGDPPRTWEIDISPLYNQFGRLEGRVIVAHDVTEHKWLEQDLIFANDTLKSQLEEINKLRDELQEQAIRDPLTNAYNRRYLSEFLDKEILRAERQQSPVSIVIMDVDGFKQFNDSYGHKCGDDVLKDITQFLNEHSRRGDVVCRYGGEEFVVLMPNVSLETAYERAEMWRQDFSETPIEYEGMELFATFSAGVATYPQHGSTGEAILQAADKALLHSKDTGKNKVTCYE
ncbi:MAG TPA: histidine kinase N-terminal 7TM domain-containing protein [Anaerolineales bacterium]|nr:histidine kinase N-terminal 7TM domain-containing protein [Anaerolineales bacterium]